MVLIIYLNIYIFFIKVIIFVLIKGLFILKKIQLPNVWYLKFDIVFSINKNDHLKQIIPSNDSTIEFNQTDVMRDTDYDVIVTTETRENVVSDVMRFNYSNSEFSLCY